MKKLVVSALALVVACPAFAGNDAMMAKNQDMMMHKSKPTVWNLWNMDAYMSVGAGASYINLNNSFNDVKESVNDMIYQGHVAFGLEVNKTLRMEMELSMFSELKDTKDFGALKDVEVKSKMTTALVNTYMELGHYKTIRPFVGLGAGVAFMDISNTAGGMEVSHSPTKFAAMGAMGLTFDMERYAIDIAARYNYVDVESGLHDFGGDIGIRFMF